MWRRHLQTCEDGSAYQKHPKEVCERCGASSMKIASLIQLALGGGQSACLTCYSKPIYWITIIKYINPSGYFENTHSFSWKLNLNFLSTSHRNFSRFFRDSTYVPIRANTRRSSYPLSEISLKISNNLNPFLNSRFNRRTG